MNKEQCWHCQYLHSRTDPNFESAADFGSHLKEPTGKRRVLAQQTGLGHMQSNGGDNERNHSDCVQLLCHKPVT